MVVSSLMRNKFVVLLLVVSFVLGVAGAQALAFWQAEGPFVELPQAAEGPQELLSPSDTVTEEQIRVYRDGVELSLADQDEDWRVYLDVKNPSWSTFTNTNSMDPLIDVGTNTIRLKVACDDLEVGDIVSYQHPSQGIIIHRIVHKDQDEEGTYFVLKGDNNPASDPGKVRCDQVLGKVIAIIY